MYFKYYSVLKREISYKIKTLSDSVLWNLIKECPESNCDINNCVIVHPDSVYPCDRILSIYHDDTKIHRKVLVIPNLLCRKSYLYISNTYFYNCFLSTIDFDVKLLKRNINIEFAEEIELSLIASPHDISNAIIDTIIEGYFKLPKLVCKGDVISVSVKHFAPASFYADPKLNSIEKLYFKCNKVRYGGKEVEKEYFCTIGQTSIKQAANVQSFIPKVRREGTRLVHRTVKCFSEVDVSRNGLEDYYDLIDDAIYPFLSTSK